MSDAHPPESAATKLPTEILDHLSKPLARFLAIETASGAILLIFTCAALALANSPWSAPFAALWDAKLGIHFETLELTRSLRDWINDGLMTLFFFLVSLELKRELVLGELNNPRSTALSVAAALGGMLVPAGLYFLLQSGHPGQHGWGTVMATDTAFVIGCLALLGSRIPHSLRVFMLSLAIVDDLGAILVVAVGYSHGVNWWAIAIAAAGLVFVRAMALLGVRSFAAFFLIGIGIWLVIDASGIHATVTGVILGLMTPAHRWVGDERLYAILDQVIATPEEDEGSDATEHRSTLQAAEVAAREALSPIERLEMTLHPWVGFVIMPLFAFANAGVSLSVDNFSQPVTLAIFVGFVVGKPVGVLAATWLAVRSGIAHRPPELSWGTLAGGAFLAGIGFTMALFIAGLAFDVTLINGAKLGILLASIVSATAGLAILFMTTRQHSSPPTD